MALPSPGSLYPMTILVRQGNGYRIIRRVRLHSPRQTPLQRLWQQIWLGGTPEQVYAHNQYRHNLEKQCQKHRIHLP